MHGVSFSPSGNKLAWVSHDSMVCVVNQESGNVSFEKTKELPFLSCQFTSETNLIVAVCVYMCHCVCVCVCVHVCVCVLVCCLCCSPSMCRQDVYMIGVIVYSYILGPWLFSSNVQARQ